MSKGSTGLTGQTGSTGSELPEMIFSDDHLPYFDVVDRALGLRGEKYQPYRKACYYSLISAPVRKVKVHQGDVEEDLRTHYAFFLPSGGGKKAIVNLLEDVLEDFDTKKPTRFHPAQLVGKTRRNEDGESEQLRGHLDADIFTKDEGYKIFTEESENYQDVRSHLNEATDTYGRNSVQKTNTETLDEGGLSYYPDANINILSQPFNISEKSVQEGLMRRFDLPYSRFKVKKRTELYRLRANPSSDLSREKSISILQDYLEELEDFYSDISTLELTEDATRYYLGFHDYMVTYGFSHSDNGSFYTNMVDFSLMDKFLKYAALQAVSRKRTKIKSQDVFRAFIDLTEFFSCKMEFLKDHLKGDISYEGDITLAQDSLQMRVLEYLYSKGATSKEKSDVSISEFKQLIVKYGDYKNKNSARRPYDKLKEQGYIDTKTESNKSFVWLEKDIEDLKSPVNQYREELSEMNYYEEANKRLGHLLNPFSPLCLAEVSTNLGFKEFWNRLEGSNKAQKTAKKHLSSGGLS